MEKSVWGEQAQCDVSSVSSLQEEEEEEEEEVVWDTLTCSLFFKGCCNDQGRKLTL